MIRLFLLFAILSAIVIAIIYLFKAFREGSMNLSKIFGAIFIVYALTYSIGATF